MNSLTVMSLGVVAAVKDPDGELPIPTSWRPTFQEVVGAFAAGDYSLERSIEALEPIDADEASLIKINIARYGDVRPVELNA